MIDNNLRVKQSCTGKSRHGYYGSVGNFHDNTNNVMNDKLLDMLKMSRDLIFHYFQKALWDPGLDRSGWWQTGVRRA